MKMQPSQFDHIIATISLFRPGPMEHIDDYIDCMHGHKPVEYRHPSLEPILRETYGVCVYQEQIIRILTNIAGYSAPDADLVRRAVGKKKKAELLKHRASFIEGAVEHGGLPQETAESIFDDIEYFARQSFFESQPVCLHNIVHVCEVSALFPIPVYFKCLVLQCPSEKTVKGHVRPLPGTIYREISQ